MKDGFFPATSLYKPQRWHPRPLPNLTPLSDLCLPSLSAKKKYLTKSVKRLGSEFFKFLSSTKPVCIATSTPMQGLNIRVGKLAFQNPCDETSWKELSSIETIQLNHSNDDYVWVASEQKIARFEHSLMENCSKGCLIRMGWCQVATLDESVFRTEVIVTF